MIIIISIVNPEKNITGNNDILFSEIFSDIADTSKKGIKNNFSNATDIITYILMNSLVILLYYSRCLITV